ncbi:Membrane protein involved in the export of O-antigen and teichoic acid [Limimonas halophila]|uniref:Membrane protein involved in the export of O-antigen and teichoic acid n=1 Tax=Limimonas halophila TaxID=1082479 RepID=A0A1G7RX92_9PROT|nr:oligosaccharide flippase family protein [Limimonas halophila]SDG15443.1 Membrane protein involved in the export of O-antigen and teichoic acid [Limimonas halophila]
MRRLRTRAAAVTAAKAGRCALGLLLTLALARWLGADAYGGYAAAMAVAQLAAVALAMGLPQLAARDGARHRATGDTGGLAGLRRCLVRHGAGVAVAAVSVAIAGLMVWADRAVTVAATAALAALLVALRLHGEWLVGAGRTLLGELGDGALRRGLFALALIPAVIWLPAAGGTALTAHALAAAGALALVAAMAGRREAHATTADGTDRARYAAALPFLGVAALNVVMANADVLMLGALAGPEAAGPYAVAARLAEMPALALLAVNAAAVPVYARAHTANDPRSAAEAARWTARTLTLLAGGTLALAWLAGPALLPLLGAGFGAGATPLMILAGAQLANAGTGAAAVLLDTAGLQRVTLTGVAAGAAVNLALNAVLIPAHGAVGAAVATGAGLVVWNALLAWQARRRVGIDATPLGLRPAVL